MRGGDLSNEIAPAIAMRFERVIKTEEGKLNKAAKAYLQTIHRIDVNVYIITTGPERKAIAFLMKWGVPYFRVIECTSTLEIADVCREMDVLTYYDYDVELLNNINSRGHGKIEAKQWTQEHLL